MNRAAVTVAEAARQLGKAPSTLRKWIANGAPCASPGAAGRGKGALVVLDELQRWRAAGNAPVMQGLDIAGLAAQLRDYHRGGDHRRVGLNDYQAQLYLAALFEYIALRLGVLEAEVDAMPLFRAGNRASE